MKYKVHYNYITPEGEFIKAGIYTPDEIDLAIARNRSIVTPVDTTVQITTTNPFDEIQLTSMDGDGYTKQGDVKELVINPTKTVTKVEKVKINTIKLEDLTKIKHVGKATAEKIIAARNTLRFESYTDLNSRVALAKNKKWEDVAVIDFEFAPKFDVTNYKVDLL